MTAVLKKRSYESITQVEQTSSGPKRFRVVYNSPAENLRQNFDKCKNNKEIFEALNDVDINSLKLDADGINNIINVLFERLAIEKKEIIRDVLTLLIHKMIARSNHNSSIWVKLILEKLKDEESSSVIGQLLSILITIGNKTNLDENQIKLILDVGKKGLNSKKHNIRCQSLKLIGHLCFGNFKLYLDDLLNFTFDDDWRVRSAAYRSILLWHMKGFDLNMDVYAVVRNGLNDSNEMVKLDTLKIISAIAVLKPNCMVNNIWTGGQLSKVRLVDACFMDLCNSFNDSSIRVRLEAAILLGDLKMVSPTFLMQTLDKNLMSDMRVKKSAHEKNRQAYENYSEFSSGKKFGADAPREVDVCPSLVPIGACGAFVHGLEDEFLCVRNASIESLCKLTLATTSSDNIALEENKFAMQCSDFLVDMFNDEIDDVRLKAVRALAKISHLFMLRDEQLHFIISILKDFFSDIRESTHSFLSHCNPASKKTFSTIIYSLLENIRKYPMDKYSIWSCMKEMGSRQNILVLSLITELLSVHPFFETKEHELDDPSYLGILVLVFNALPKCSTMFSMLPQFLTRHYIHVRNTMPELIPDIKAGQFLVHIKELNIKRGCDEEILKTQFNQISLNLKFANCKNILQILKLSICDLRKIGELLINLKSKIKCQLLYLQSYMILYKLLLKQTDMLKNMDLQSSICSFKKAIFFMNKLELSFTDLDEADWSKIKSLKLKLNCLKYFLFKFYNNRVNMQDFVNFIRSQKIKDTDFLKIFDKISESSFGVDSLQLLVSYLRDTNSFSLLKLDGEISALKIEVHDTIDTETIYHFLPNMILSLPILIDLYNFKKIESFRIIVDYPDGSRLSIVPPSKDFKKMSQKFIRLNTKAFISHHHWTDPGKVEISFSLNYEESSESFFCFSDLKKENLINISKPIFISIHPSLKKDKHFN